MCILDTQSHGDATGHTTSASKKFRWALLAAVLAVVAFAVPASADTRADTATLYIANGWSLPDVGVAAGLAATDSGTAALLYGSTGGLGPHEIAMLRDYQPARVVLVGGNAVLPTSIEDTIADEAPGAEVTRIAGDDRRHTAALAARSVLGDPVQAQVDASYACRRETSHSFYQINSDGRAVRWDSVSGLGDVYQEARCEWSLRNLSGSPVRVVLTVSLRDAGDNYIPGTTYDVADGGLWLGVGQQQSVNISAGTYDHNRDAASGWISSGKHLSAWCRYWTDTHLVTYPGVEQSEPCNVTGNGRAN